MYKKIRGVVVGSYDFDENSKILKVFYEDGIISIIAKGAKKNKSPFFAISSKITLGDFNIIYKENAISKLIEGDVINNFSKIKKDFKSISYATYITELATKVYMHDNNKNIYKLYLSSIIKINEGYDSTVVSLILRLKYLEYLGIKPNIDSCVECGSKNNIITISSYKGGFICKNCIKKETIVSLKTIKLIRLFFYVDINKIKKIDISPEIINEIVKFTNDYYDRYSGIILKSSEIINY